MAYSGIAHTGFLLLPLMAMNELSASSVLYYSAAYSLATVTLFGIFMLLKNAPDGNGSIELFAGLGRRNPFLAFLAAVAFISLAGIPVTAGFFAKYYAFVSAVKGGFYWIVILAILTALVGVYYYLRILSSMYFQTSEKQKIRAGKLYSVPLVLAVILILLIGIFPSMVTCLL
jgi:NADH-quinone oxidoreductase subunit N